MSRPWLWPLCPTTVSSGERTRRLSSLWRAGSIVRWVTAISGVGVEKVDRFYLLS